MVSGRHRGSSIADETGSISAFRRPHACCHIRVAGAGDGWWHSALSARQAATDEAEQAASSRGRCRRPVGGCPAVGGRADRPAAGYRRPRKRSPWLQGTLGRPSVSSGTVTVQIHYQTPHRGPRNRRPEHPPGVGVGIGGRCAGGDGGYVTTRGIVLQEARPTGSLTRAALLRRCPRGHCRRRAGRAVSGGGPAALPSRPGPRGHQGTMSSHQSYDSGLIAHLLLARGVLGPGLDHPGPGCASASPLEIQVGAHRPLVDPAPGQSDHAVAGRLSGRHDSGPVHHGSGDGGPPVDRHHGWSTGNGTRAVLLAGDRRPTVRARAPTSIGGADVPGQPGGAGLPGTEAFRPTTCRRRLVHGRPLVHQPRWSLWPEAIRGRPAGRPASVAPSRVGSATERRCTDHDGIAHLGSSGFRGPEAAVPDGYHLADTWSVAPTVEEDVRNPTPQSGTGLVRSSEQRLGRTPSTGACPRETLWSIARDQLGSPLRWKGNRRSQLRPPAGGRWPAHGGPLDPARLDAPASAPVRK